MDGNCVILGRQKALLYTFFVYANICKLAFNVLGIRRSSPPYKANRRFAVGWNVGEKKHHKGR